MADLGQAILSWTLSSLQSAFEAGEDQLKAQRDRAKRDLEQHLATPCDDGEAPAWVDEDTGRGISNEEYLTATAAIARQALQSHRKAFAVMIHHAWEKHVCQQMDWETYKVGSAYALLQKAGWAVEQEHLERLRMIANCIKHTDAALFECDQEMFYDPDGDGILALFQGKRKRQKPNEQSKYTSDGHYCSWDDALYLRDNHIEEFFDAVRRSSGRA